MYYDAETSESHEVSRASNSLVAVISVIALLLVAAGISNLYSASTHSYIVRSQMNNMIIALGVFVCVGWLFPAQKLADIAPWAYYGTLLLLIFVMFGGEVTNGSRRWISIGPLRGQPSEFAKLAMAMMVARFFAANRIYSAYRLRDLWPLGIYIGIYFALIAMQPDLGTGGVCVIIACSQIFFMNIHKRSMTIVTIASLLFFTCGWFFFLHDYQRLRILNFLNPQMDPFGSGYNIQQSLIAIGSGGLLGKGFFQGTQTQLEFLPARDTDFVLSVFAEEHGFFLTLALFGLYTLLTLVGFEVARRAKNTFCSLLAIGIAANLFIQFFINVAMVLAMFPVVGMPLPLFSHGGSSLIANFLGLGMLVSISRYSSGKIKDKSLTIQNLLKPI